MSFMSDYKAALKKLKKEEEEKATSKKTTTKKGAGSSTVKSVAADNSESSFMETYRVERDRLLAEQEDDIQSQITVGDLAPVKSTTQEDSGLFDGWFKKGNKDVSKTILGTIADLGEDLTTGIVGLGEKIVDAGAWLAPIVSKSQYYQNGGGYNLEADRLFEEQNQAAKEEMSKFIAKDLYDEGKVAKQILSNLYAFQEMTNIAQNGGMFTQEDLDRFNKNRGSAYNYMVTDMEKDSVLDEKSDSLVQSAGQLGATAALSAVGVPWYLITGASTFGSEAENALNQGATFEEAGLSATISAGAEILTEKISGGIKFGGKTLDDGLTKLLSRNISNRAVRTAAKLGIDMAGEGGEEILSGLMSAIGQKLTYAEEKELEELFSKEDRWEAFIGGAVLGGVGSATQAAKGSITGVDSVTELTKNEQAVVDKLYEDALAEEAKNGKVTQKKKAEIYDDILYKLEKGYIDTDIIEEVLGGDSYNTYKETLDSENALAEQEKKLNDEFKSLNKMVWQEMTGEQHDRREELRGQLEELRAKIADPQSKANKDMLKAQLTKDVYEMSKGDRLVESFFEQVRSKQKYEADLTKYEGRARDVIKKVMESGLADNTNQTHEFWDWAAKMASDLDTDITLAENEQLLEMVKEEYKANGEVFDESQFEGQTIDGYASKNGIVLNAASKRALNFIVGHEVTHKLEKSKHYGDLQKLLFEYAKDEYESRFNKRSGQYSNKFKADDKYKSKVDMEVTGDLVGDYLFTDKGFIDHLTKDQNVFQQVWNEVKYMAKIATAGSEQAKQLEKVKREFERAYREANKKAQSGTQFSVSDETDTDKKSFYDLTFEDIDKMSDEELEKAYKELGFSNYLELDDDFQLDDEFLIGDGLSLDSISEETNVEPEAIKILYKRAGLGTSHVEDKHSAVMTQKRIDQRIAEHGATAPDYARAYITRISPKDFIDMTVYERNRDRANFDSRVRGDLDSRMGEWDYEKQLRDSEEPPRLVVDISTGQIINHNGRHRVRALEMAGIESVEIEVEFHYEDGSMVKYNAQTIPDMAISSQFDTAIETHISNIIPFNKAHKAEIERSYGENAHSNAGVKYSVSDSDGKELTKEQQDYFKDSKMRDENGNLKVMYHGSKHAGFHVFDAQMSDDDISFFFTDSNEVASSYSRTREVYEARTFHTAKEMNKFLAEIGYDDYEVVKSGGKYTLHYDVDEVVATSDNLKDLYNEFCDYAGVGEGEANYKVYLNLKNPLEVDAEGRNWDNVSQEFYPELYEQWKNDYFTDEEKAALEDLAGWEDYSTFKAEVERAVRDAGKPTADEYTKAISSAFWKHSDVSSLFSIASDNFSDEVLKAEAVKQMDTRDYAQKAKAEGYDGVIFKNLVDIGEYGRGHTPSTVAIAFDSNQIKSTANAQPTTDPDIRYSVSEAENQKGLNREQEVVYSISYDSTYMDNAIKRNEANKGKYAYYVDSKRMEEAKVLREKVAARMNDIKDRGLVGLPEDMEGNTYIANSSYDGTEENTTICPRSLAAEAFVDAVSEYLGRPLTVKEQIYISQDLQGRSLTPECTYCYVATDRKAYRAFLGEYINQRDSVLQKLSDNPNADVSRSGELYKEFLNGRKDTNPMYNRFKMWVDAYQNGTPMVDASHLANINRLMGEIKSEFGEALKPQIVDAMKYAQSASWAKKRINYVAYNGHILNWKQDRINKLNSHYGLRMYSFSDFHPAFVLENMQMITDASVRGLKMLGYTKDTDFVEIFAPSGMNINVSTFGFESGGNVYENNLIGAEWEKAKALRAQYPNVGVTFVATNDTLVNWALEQDWIDVVIPYHLVRTGAEVAEAFKYTNYTSESADTKTKDWVKGDKKSIAPTEHNNDLATYLAALEKNHLKPRFERFIDNPNYMKLVNECRQPASMSKPVQPVFNEEAAMKALAKLEANGYYQPIGGSVDRMYEIAAEVAEDMTNNIAPVSQFSVSDNDYMDAVNRGDTDTAQNMVDDAARSAGYEYRMFHETDADNIHVFDISRGDHGATDYETPYGIFTKTSAKNIGLGSRQMALFVKAQNTLRVEDREDVRNKIPGFEQYYNQIQEIDSKYDALSEELEDEEFDALAEWMGEHPDADMDVLLPNSYIIEGKPADIDSERYLEAHRKYQENKAEWSKAYDAVAVKAKEFITNYLRNNGYDSMYFKVDGGSRGRQTDSLIVLDPNQVKSAKPVTYDDNGDVIPLSERFNSDSNDTRYSVSDKGEQFAPIGRYNVYAKDMLLNKDDISPVAENAAGETISKTESVPVVGAENETTTEELFPDNLAPVQSELEQLMAEEADMRSVLEGYAGVGDIDAVNRLLPEYEEIRDRIRELEADENQRADSLTDEDAPPVKEAPYYGNSKRVMPRNPFADREWDDVVGTKNRSVKAYMYEHPEVKPFFQEEAMKLLGELNDTTRGERFFNDQVYYESGGEKGITGVKRHTSESMETLLDDWGMSYAEIEKGLKAIIEDNGAENITAAKKIEFMLNNRLLNGYKNFYGKGYIEANQDYIDTLEEMQINSYSKEAFDALMANADQYAPVAPVVISKMETTTSLAEATPDTDPAPIFESKDKDAVKGQTTMFEPPKPNPNPKVANVLTEETAIQKEKSGIGGKLVSALVDKGMVFENLSLETGNHEVQAKWNYALPSNTEARAQYFMEHGADGVKPLKDIKKTVDKSGKTEKFYDYLYHVHNIDRMTLEDRFDDVPNKTVFGETITADVSRKKVAQYEKANPEFKNWANDVYAFNKHLRSLLVENDIISQETADLWEKMYPHYVPIRRVDSEGQNISVPLDSRKTGVNNPVKRATGGSSDIMPLFETMAQRTEQTYRAIARNAFGIELKNTLGTTIEAQKDATGVDEMIDTIEAQEDHLLKPGSWNSKPTFTVFENGERVEFEITEDMYNALKPADGLLAHRSKAIGKVGDVRRNLLTVWNPVFALYRNPIKDIQDVAVNSQHAAKTYLNVPNAIVQMATGGKYATEYHQNGGKSNTYFDSRTNKFKAEDNLFKKAIGLPVRAIETAGEFIEEIPRLAEYIASRKNGRSVERSMLDAARVTTNFAAGGDFTKFLNSHGFTFLNASVQGASQHVRNFREAKQEGLKGYVKVLAKYTIAGLPTILLNGLLWDDDEEYEELSDYVKQNYYVVAKTQDGKFVRIPKGRTAAVMGELMQQMDNLRTGNDEADFSTFFELFMNNIAPSNPIENNILAPIIQTASNKAWYGGDLVPSRLQDLPAEEQFDESTDSISKWLGEKTGFSPYKINYLLDQYSGGLGDVFLPMLTPEAESGDDTTLGNFLAPWKKEITTDSVLNNKNPGDFYDLRDELEVTANGKNATEEDKMRSMYMDSVSWEMGDLYAQKREIQSSDLPDDEKYESVREVQEQINELAKTAMQGYNDVTIEGLYSEVGNKRYNMDAESGKWYEIKAKNADGTANYYYQKEQTVTKALGISYAEYWNNREEYNYAYDKPEQYALAQAVGGYQSYRGFTSELWDIKADKDKNGKSISGSRKRKVVEYLNDLDADYYTKIILFKNEYNADNTYNYEIIDYLNGRDDISYEQMETILKYLGFEVDSEGNISW